MNNYASAENREYFQGVIDRATVQIDGYLEQWKLAEEPDRSIWRLYISRAHAEIEHFRQGIDCVDGKISDQIFMFRHANYLLRQKMLLIEIRDFFEPTLRSEQYKIDPEYRRNINARLSEIRQELASFQSSFDQHMAHMRDEIAEREAHASQI